MLMPMWHRADEVRQYYAICACSLDGDKRIAEIDRVGGSDLTACGRMSAVTDKSMQKPVNGKGPELYRPIVIGLLALALAGCATDMFGSRPTTTGSTSPPQPGFGDKVSDFFRGQPEKTAADSPQANTGGQANPLIDCPRVEIREGAGTYAQNVAEGDQSALGVRMQATFGQNARECHVNAGMLTIKVGVQGRVILGPAGAPGDLIVPLRYALVQEGIEPKTIWTKFYAVPVSVPPGNTNVPFAHVQEDIAVPMPKSSELDAYVVYIGFDPNGLSDSLKKKPSPKSKSKARTSSAATGQVSAR
jgi:hypothetical protein